MNIPLFIHGNRYEEVTIDAWQCIWDKICKMSYEGTDICERIVTRPGVMHINGRVVQDRRETTHSQEYSRREPLNDYFLSLDNIWKQYSGLYGSADVKVIPELKQLVVPRALYESLGVQQWFRYSFPNCVVTFWNE